MPTTRSDITEKARAATAEAEVAEAEARAAEAEANAAMKEVEALQAAAEAKRRQAAEQRAEAAQAKAQAVALTADLRCVCHNRHLVPTMIIGPDGNPTIDGPDVYWCPACSRVHKLNTDGDVVKLETVIAHASLQAWRSL